MTGPRPKPWVCRLCGRGFATEKVLYRHERYCQPAEIGAGPHFEASKHVLALVSRAPAQTNVDVGFEVARDE